MPSSSTKAVIVIEPSDRLPKVTVPEEVMFVADNVAPLNDKSESSERTPFVPANTTLPLVNPSAVSVPALRS